jgi:hypothetical protein
VPHGPEPPYSVVFSVLAFHRVTDATNGLHRDRTGGEDRFCVHEEASLVHG